MGLISSRIGIALFSQTMIFTACGPERQTRKSAASQPIDGGSESKYAHISEASGPEKQPVQLEQEIITLAENPPTDQPDPIGGSPGCNLTGRDLGLKNVSIRVGSTSRSFIRVVDNNYDNKRKHALIIGFHGYGLDGTSPRVHHKWNQVELMAGDEAIFIYPNALGGSWNGSSGSSPDVLFFDEIVRSTGDLYCLDRNRVFVHGFSNGGFFVNALAWHRSSAIRAVTAVAGGGGGAKVPAMVIHGTGDPNVGYYFGQQSLSAYAKSNGCGNVNFGAMKIGECQQVAACQAEYPTWFCPWNGNHHWPEFSLPSVWGFISSFK